MSDSIHLARNTPVADTERLLAIEPLLVGRDDDILAVVRRSVAQPATRILGVVDDDGVLIGVLPILRIAESVVARVVPEALLSDIFDIADVAEFGHTLESRTAGDAMIESAGIAPEATIDEAFRLMHKRHLSGLYVVDADGRPIGYLDMLELALLYVNAIELGSMPNEGLSTSPST